MEFDVWNLMDVNSSVDGAVPQLLGLEDRHMEVYWNILFLYIFHILCIKF